MKAIKIRYVLKAKSKTLQERNQPELVLAEISGAFSSKVNGKIDYSKIQFSLETHILPKYFGIIRAKRGVENYVYDINTITNNEKYNKVLRNKINDFKSHIENAQTHFIDQDPSTEEFKKHLHLITGRLKREPTAITLILNFLINHIKHLERIIGSGRKDEVEENTINSFRNLIPVIKRNEEAKKNNKITFEKLDEKSYREIWQVINDIKTGKTKIESYTRKPGTPYKINSIRAYQNYFIKLCKIAQKEGVNIPLDLSDENLINGIDKNKYAKTEAYLKENDILKIMEYIPTSKNLELAKKYIILASLMGMRLQSMREAVGRQIVICKDEAHSFFYLHVIHEKTKSECYTPLFKDPLNIIQNNDGVFPDFNQIRLSNLNNNIRKIIKLSGVVNSNLFSTHNMRSTFVTNLSLLNVNKTYISIITHPKKTDSTNSVSIYDRRDMLDKAQMFTEAIIKANKIKKSKLYNFIEEA